jgi:hypothetical protein
MMDGARLSPVAATPGPRPARRPRSLYAPSPSPFLQPSAPPPKKNPSPKHGNNNDDSSFATAIHHAPPGQTSHVVDLSKFHDVVPHKAVAAAAARSAAAAAASGAATPARARGPGRGPNAVVPATSSDPAILLTSEAAAEAASRAVVLGGARRLPTPRLLENTLALSDELCVTPRAGRLLLCLRVGDTYPSQMALVRVAMYLYRYGDPPTGEGEARPVTVRRLELDAAEPVLRYPVVVAHDLGPVAAAAGGGGGGGAGGAGGGGGGGGGKRDGGSAVAAAAAAAAASTSPGSSPVAAWATPEGLAADRYSEIVVTVSAQLYAAGGRLCTRSRVYPAAALGGGGASAGGRIRHGWAFAPCVESPAEAADGRTRVHWHKFHATVPLTAHAEEQAKKEQAWGTRGLGLPGGQDKPAGCGPAAVAAAALLLGTSSGAGDSSWASPPLPLASSSSLPPRPPSGNGALQRARSSKASGELPPPMLLGRAQSSGGGRQQQEEEEGDETASDEARGVGPEWEAAERRGSVIGNNPMAEAAAAAAAARGHSGDDDDDDRPRGEGAV